MIPEHLIFIDLETTGANSLRDRITEVGFCEVENGQLVREWSSLINPETPISPFIEQLTGITNAMVVDAPRFAEIAGDLKDRLSGKLLVAHNARFDYGFLKSEFRREAIDFNEKTLCTVKLSRSLYPGQKRHNLDTIISRHGLKVENRHRALADAQLIQNFFAKLCTDHPDEVLAQAIRAQLKQPSLPPHLPREQIESLPSAPGVYLVYGENDPVLYVGKSLDIRARVLSHFSGDHRNRKGMKLSQQARRIDYVETAGELGALLLEARLVKELVPVHNRRLRRTRDLFSIYLQPGLNGASQAEILPLSSTGSDQLDRLYGTFRTRRQAVTALHEAILALGLCNKVLGLEKGSGACFNYQIKKCRGACVGEDPLELHEARLAMALAKLKLRSWPYPGAVGIEEISPAGDRTEIHVLDNWRHLGTADSKASLWQILAECATLPFDLDSYKILTRFLEKKKQHIRFVDLSSSASKFQVSSWG